MRPICIQETFFKEHFLLNYFLILQLVLALFPMRLKSCLLLISITCLSDGLHGMNLERKENPQEKKASFLLKKERRIKGHPRTIFKYSEIVGSDSSYQDSPVYVSISPCDPKNFLRNIWETYLEEDIEKKRLQNGREHVKRSRLSTLKYLNGFKNAVYLCRSSPSDFKHFLSSLKELEVFEYCRHFGESTLDLWNPRCFRNLKKIRDPLFYSTVENSLPLWLKMDLYHPLQYIEFKPDQQFLKALQSFSKAYQKQIWSRLAKTETWNLKDILPENLFEIEEAFSSLDQKTPHLIWSCPKEYEKDQEEQGEEEKEDQREWPVLNFVGLLAQGSLINCQNQITSLSFKLTVDLFNSNALRNQEIAYLVDLSLFPNLRNLRIEGFLEFISNSPNDLEDFYPVFVCLNPSLLKTFILEQTINLGFYDFSSLFENLKNLESLEASLAPGNAWMSQEDDLEMPSLIENPKWLNFLEDLRSLKISVQEMDQNLVQSLKNLKKLEKLDLQIHSSHLFWGFEKSHLFLDFLKDILEESQIHSLRFEKHHWLAHATTVPLSPEELTRTLVLLNRPLNLDLCVELKEENRQSLSIRSDKSPFFFYPSFFYKNAQGTGALIGTVETETLEEDLEEGSLEKPLEKKIRESLHIERFFPLYSLSKN